MGPSTVGHLIQGLHFFDNLLLAGLVIELAGVTRITIHKEDGSPAIWAPHHLFLACVLLGTPSCLCQEMSASRESSVLVRQSTAVDMGTSTLSSSCWGWATPSSLLPLCRVIGCQTTACSSSVMTVPEMWSKTLVEPRMTRDSHFWDTHPLMSKVISVPTMQ